MSPKVAGILLGIAVAVPFFLFGCKTREQTASPDTQPARNQAADQAARPTSQPPDAPCTFEWVDQKKDLKTWNVASAAFQEELRPDQPTDNLQTISYTIKQIARIGRCGNAGFVQLEKRSTRKEWGEPFGPAELYNFDLPSKTKSKIETHWPLWAWKYRQLARFDGAAPDITFESATCSNCDAAATLLFALRFNPKAQKWELRRWVENDPGVVIFDMNQESNVAGYQTVSGIADFDGAGHDELAVWSHFQEAAADNGPAKLLPPVTSVTIFSFRNGTALGTTISDEAEVRRIKETLCKLNADAETCKKPSS